MLTAAIAAAGSAARGWASPSQALLESFTGGGRARAGVSVNEATALGVPAVYAAVNVLAQTIAQLPCKVFRRLPSGGRVAEINHPLYSILHDLANPEMTAYEWRSVTVGHLALWGNAFSEIERDSSGRVIALWPLRPDRMRIDRLEDGGLRYTYALPGNKSVEWIRPARSADPVPILHLRGLSGDGLIGYSPIRMMRESLGLAIAAEAFGAGFFGAGAAPSMVVKLPGKLKPDAQTRLRAGFERLYGGLDRAHRIAILEEGMTIEKVGIPPNDAQFLETRRFQIEEVARMFRIPPHLLQDLARATFSNIEHQAIAFVTLTLLPWLVSFEQAYARDLLSVKSFYTHEVRFSVDGLLRGDTASRFASYAIGRQWGWMSVNEIRALENLNPVAGGDEYLRPLNMEQIAAGKPDPAAGRSMELITAAAAEGARLAAEGFTGTGE